MLATVGSTLKLRVQLPDGNTGKFPLAHVVDQNNVPVTGSPFSLTHVANGLYANSSYTVLLANQKLFATYISYDDAPHAIESTLYGREVGWFDVETSVESVKIDTLTIKAKTDQLNFDGANILSRVAINDDKSQYSLTVAERNSISDVVWDEVLGFHLSPGSAGEALASVTPTEIANSVWNALVSSYASPNTFGLYIDVIRQYVASTSSSITSGIHGLAAIKADVLNSKTDVISEVNANETKIDLIVPAINTARDVLISEIDQNEIKINNLSTQLTNTGASVVSEINQNEVKLDALVSQIGTIQNNTTSRFIVPSEVYRPDIGSKTYQFHLRLYDTVGNPESPDSTPTIRIRRLDSGLDVVTGVPMTTLGSTGAYYYDFIITAGTNLYPFLVEATVVENGITRLVPAVSEIVEFQSDLNLIQAAVSVLDTKANDIQTKVNDPTYGLQAIKNNQANIISEIDQNEAKINLIKVKTDLIPADPATETSVADVKTTVLSRPTLSQIITQLNLIKDSIKGIGNYAVTDVFNAIDFTPLAKTNDPRFNNLDATISSRSTLTASQVWLNATRTLTSVVLPPTEIQKIWDVLTSALVTPNSIGKHIIEFLDTKVSTRATSAQVSSALSGVAQEATVSTGFGVTNNSLATLTSASIVVTNLLNLIQAKTTNLPGDPASNTNVDSKTVVITNAIAALQLLVAGVKTKTDNLPIDPAKETSVQARPINPVLSTDVRMARLDATVSSRSTLAIADLGFLATDTDVIAARNLILSSLIDIASDVDAANAAIVQRPTTSAVTALIAPVAKSVSLSAAESNILSAISGISLSAPTPAQIWSHVTRTLTASPTDISSLATSAQVAAITSTFYENKMSTVYNGITGNQELIAWAEKSGQRVLSSSDCSVTIKTSAGITKWSSTLLSPNADGIFKFTNAFVPTSNENYYIIVEIVVDSIVRTSNQAFFTVG